MNSQRGPLITILMVGGGLLVYLGIRIEPTLPEDGPSILWAILFGLVFFVLGLVIFQDATGSGWVSRGLEKVSAWLGVTQLQVVLLVMGPICGYVTVLYAGFGKRMYFPAVAVIAWILGIGLALAGGMRPGEKPSKPSRSTLLWLAALVVIAFLFRGIATAQLPVVLSGDEGSSGIAAVGFINGEWNNIFVASWFSFPSLFYFLQSLTIRLLGQTTEALRLFSALAGALTVGVVYLSGKAMFGQRAGVFAALALAALHYHIHFSRIGLNNIWDGLWFTVAVAAMSIAWERNQRWAYLLAGLALGFAQFFYVSSRGLFGVVLAAVFLAFLFQRERFKRALPDVFLMFLVTTAVLLPLAWFFIRQPNQFVAPMARVSFFKILETLVATTGQPAWKILLEQIWTGLQAYTIVPVRFWYRPEAPILRPIFAAFFYLGMVLLLWKHRDSRLTLLGLWLAVFGVMGGLSESVPAAQRYVASAPACALIVGLGLHKSTETLESLWQKSAKVFTGLGYTILVVAMLSDLYFYYIDYFGKDAIDNIESNGMIAQHVADVVKVKPPGTQAAFFIVPSLGYYSIPSIQYLAPQIQGIDVPEPWSVFDRTQLNEKQVVFIFPPGREGEALEVTQEYPGGFLYSETGVNGEILFWVYDLP